MRRACLSGRLCPGRPSALCVACCSPAGGACCAAPRCAPVLGRGWMPRRGGTARRQGGAEKIRETRRHQPPRVREPGHGARCWRARVNGRVCGGAAIVDRVPGMRRHGDGVMNGWTAARARARGLWPERTRRSETAAVPPSSGERFGSGITRTGHGGNSAQTVFQTVHMKPLIDDDGYVRFNFELEILAKIALQFIILWDCMLALQCF